MSSINPFSGYLAAGASVERVQAADKTRQVRRAQALSKDVAARDDELEHQVESTEEVGRVKDETGSGGGGGREGGRKKKTDDDKPHLDVKA